MAVKKEVQMRAASQARVRMFIQMARKYGASELKVGEIEIKLAQLSRIPNSIDNKEKAAETESERAPTDEEMLNWSTEHYDTLQSQK